MAKKTTPALSSYISRYNTTIKLVVIKSNAKLVSLISNPSLSDMDKAKVLLIGATVWYQGCHQWYLKMYPVLMADLLRDIVARRLWTISLHGYSSFEDVYKDIASWLKRKYVGQTTIYDVALRLIIARKEARLMPKDYVYVHAKPIKAYRDLVNRGLVKHKQTKWPAHISVTSLPEFGTMEPYHIENMLCEMGKGHL